MVGSTGVGNLVKNVTVIKSSVTNSSLENGHSNVMSKGVSPVRVNKVNITFKDTLDGLAVSNAHVPSTTNPNSTIIPSLS